MTTATGRRTSESLPAEFQDAGLSYRQVDHWCRRGYLRPTRATTAGECSGNPRRWSETEIAVGVRMAALIAEGYRHDVAAQKAREENQ